MTEQFKDVEGFDGYMIGDKGTVISYRKHKLPYAMTHQINQCGRHAVALMDRYNKKTKQIAALMAQAFIPNPDGKKRVKFLDGNPNNLNIDNITWC